MEKKKDFIMVPMFIDDDPRLKPWLEDSRANDREIIWAVERMIGRLAKLKDKPCSIGKLLEGLHRRQLPFPLLKEIVVASGLFEYEDGYVWYNWDRFSKVPFKSAPKDCSETAESSGEMCSQCVPNVFPVCSSTHACDLKATNVDKDIDVDVDNSHTKKEKEKKESAPISGDGYESRIHDIVQHYPFREGELVGWGGKSEVENRARLEKCLIGLLNDQYSSMAQKVGSYLKQKDYRERWRDIVMAYVVQLDGTGTMSRLANVSQVRHYFFALAKQNDENSRAYQAGLCMAEELEEKRKAKIEEEKKRFPFEDYDPERGTRYVGNEPIPWDAPPRPDNSSRWDYEECRWVSWEEQMAERNGNTQTIQEVMEIIRKRQAELMKK